MAEGDTAWLKTWALAVVHASKRDHSERSSSSEPDEAEQDTDDILESKTIRPTTSETTGSRHPAPRDPPDPIYTGTQPPPPHDGNPLDMHTESPFVATISEANGSTSTGSEGVSGDRREGSVQALRKAMKADIRERYAFSGTAKLWAREISEHRHQRKTVTRR